MTKFALVALLALELLLSGCGATNNSTTNNDTSASGNWEAQLTGGTDQASLLNFVTTFSVTNTGPLDVTGFAFFNAGSCFANGNDAESVSGDATLTTSSTSAVTGTLNMTIASNTNGSVLTLTGDLTGTSSGTSTTSGTLSNGVVVGSWSLSPGANTTGCNAGAGDFVMCQGKATCSTTASAAVKKF